MNPVHQNKARKAATGRPGAQTRAISAQAVLAVEQGVSLGKILPQLLADLSPLDRALVQEIVYGTVRHRRLLGHTLSSYLTQKLKERHAIVRCLLLCGLYQLAFTRIPEHAVVSSCVDATHLCRCGGHSGLVNAVLRRFIREHKKLLKPDTVAVQYSFPDWLHQRLNQAYGDKTPAIMAALSNQAPMWLRATCRRISAAKLQDKFSAAGIATQMCQAVPCALRLERSQATETLPGFSEGLFAVQDINAQRAALLLTPDSGQRVLDCCCAPGGKSAHIMDLADVDLTCVDADQNRLDETRTRLAALGYSPQFLCLDMSEMHDELGTFDRVLLDAPCSGSGVIRRHPDIKWLRRERDIEKLAAQQQKILDAAFSRLRPGGILLYATCSVLPEENQQVVTQFMQSHPEADFLPLAADNDSMVNMWQILPGECDGDGFFYARITRR